MPQNNCHSMKSRGLNHFLSGSLLISGCFLALNAAAGNMGTIPTHEFHNWSVTASLGYTNYQYMNASDGQTALGRLAIGHAFYNTNEFVLGLELGVQNGNTMRLNVAQSTLNLLGGLPIQSTVKPMLDLLVTAKSQSFGATPFFGELKGGIAYRQWQFDDRSTINNLSNIAGEVQVGVGYSISPRATLALFYQGIFGGNPNFTVNASAATASVSTIPIQHGALLSLEVAL